MISLLLTRNSDWAKQNTSQVLSVELGYQCFSLFEVIQIVHLEAWVLIEIHNRIDMMNF